MPLIEARGLTKKFRQAVKEYCLFMAVMLFRIGLRRYESTGH
jgi:hypothetical protein